jgi:hypothetical protein
LFLGGFEKGNPGCRATAQNRAESRMLRTFGLVASKPDGNLERQGQPWQACTRRMATATVGSTLHRFDLTSII